MRGFPDKRSKDSGVNDEHSHTGKIDKEENWRRMRYSRGTSLGSRFAETFCPIARVLSWLGRRASFDSQSPRQELASVTPYSSTTPSPATAVTEAISGYVADPSDLPSVTSIVQLSAYSYSSHSYSYSSSSPPLQIALTTPVPSTTGNLTTKHSDHYITEYNPRNESTTTIAPTTSSHAKNGTGDYLTTTPITVSSGSSVILTTLATPNRTSSTTKTWTHTTTTSRGMNTTTTWKTSTTSTTVTATNSTTKLPESDLTTSTSTSTYTSVLNYYPGPQPQPTPGIYTAPSPTNSETETDSTPAVEPQVVGGIVGGVAGLALVILAIFMLLKRYKRQQAIQALNDAGYGGPLASPSMVQRSISFLGGGFGPRYRDVSPPGTADVGSAETGFVKVSGRKLPPVISGSRPEFGSLRSNAQSSYYTGDDSGVGASGTSRSSHGPTRYSSSTVQASNPFASPPSSPTNIGPARRGDNADNDSIEEIRTLPRSPPPRPIYYRQLSLISDGVGRSHASHDGSRGSRFTEDIT